MKKSTRNALTVVAAALGFAGTTACEDREVSLQIENVAPISAETCFPDGDETRFLGSGVVDLALARSYSIVARVTNNMFPIETVKRYTPQDGVVETHDVVLDSAIIEFSALEQLRANVAQSIKVPLTGTVALTATRNIPVEVFSPLVLEELRNSPDFRDFDAQNQVRPLRTQVKVLATVRLEGKTLDGKPIESNEFLFPIDICNGCLVTFPPAALRVDENDGAIFCVTANELDDGEQPDPINCPALVGSDDRFVSCVECRGFAVDPVAAQLCSPVQP